jgi:hypothetical protein
MLQLATAADLIGRSLTPQKDGGDVSREGYELYLPATNCTRLRGLEVAVAVLFVSWKNWSCGNPKSSRRLFPSSAGREEDLGSITCEVRPSVDSSC